jgi:hypothetical protein
MAAGSITGYLWLKDRPERVKSRHAAEAMIAGLAAQKEAINSYGDLDFNTANINLAILEEKLHQPTLRKSGTHDSTTLGWACANTSCTILASFATPYGQEIPATAVPVALAVIKPFPLVTHTLAIDGLQVGSTVEETERTCEKRGYGVPLRKNRITCDDGWSVGWADLNGSVDVLSFGNEKLLSDGKTRLNGIPSSRISGQNKDAR